VCLKVRTAARRGSPRARLKTDVLKLVPLNRQNTNTRELKMIVAPVFSVGLDSRYFGYRTAGSDPAAFDSLCWFNAEMVVH
jgi:hypothetical protein